MDNCFCEQWFADGLFENLKQEVEALPLDEELKRMYDIPERFITQGIKRFKQKKSRAKPIFKTLQKACVWLLVISVAVIGLLLLDDDIRAAVSKLFIERSVQFFTVDFSDNEADGGEEKKKLDSRDFVIGYIPESFELTQENKGEDIAARVYTADDGRTLNIIIMTGDGISYIDNEDVSIDYTVINGCEAIIIELLDEPTIGVVYGNEQFQISVSGQLKKEEIIKIAKNISNPVK